MLHKRITLIIALVVISSLLLAACAAPTEAPAPVEPAATEAPAAEEPAATEAPAAEEPAAEAQQLEVFSWWTGGGEAAGLEAMIAIWQEKYPDIEFVNAAVAGGAGSNAKAVLATRLAAGDPPDSWQGHAGQELIGAYVSAGQLEPLDDLYAANGWYEIFPETLIPLLSQDGHPYSVPVNIHRANVLWYNPKVLTEKGVAAPTDFASFIVALDALKAAGMEAPLALGEAWTEVHMFETILLATVGPEMYTALWLGEADWADAKVTEAINNVKKLMEYVNTDYATLSWQDASKLVADGDAAFNIMGDWADGYFYGDVAGGNLGLTPLTDYAWMPVPGTQGVYQFLSDSFVLPVGAKNRDAAIKWLELCGSKEGQDAFNPVKGSIAARKDSDKTLYNVYLQSAMDDWSKDVVVGSLAHGVVANPSWATQITTDWGAFVIDFNAETFQAALVASCAEFGPCGK